MKVWITGGLAFAVGIAACSGQVDITAEKAGSTQGAGGAGSSGVGSTSGASSSTGAGAGGPGFAKVITADTDIGQYVSVVATSMAPSPVQTKVIEGPFFVTDVLFQNGVYISVVQGNDCDVSDDKHVIVASLDQNTFSKQHHGMRIPVLVGQSLCTLTSLNVRVNVMGFKPY